MVDAYFGPRELAAAVDAAPPVEPRTLVAEAETLLEELEDGWLRDQVVGLRTYAGVLAGESRSYADEVEGCYGVRPTYTDEAIFTAAHERLEELLPGAGPLTERYERWESSARLPAEQIERTLEAAIEEARAWTRSGRATGRRRNPLGSRARQAVVGVLRLPRRPAQPGRRQRRPADGGNRAARAREPRDVPRSSLGTVQQGAPTRARARAAGGDAGARAHPAIAHLGGNRQARAVPAARGRRRYGAGCGHPGRRRRSRSRSRSRRQTRFRAVRVGPGQRGADAARRGSKRGRDRGLSQALGADDPEVDRTHDSLLHRADLSDLHLHLPRRTRALPLVRGGRAGALPPLADRTGSCPRPACAGLTAASYEPRKSTSRSRGGSDPTGTPDREERGWVPYRTPPP